MFASSVFYACVASGLREIHLLERRAAEKPVRARERFVDLEVVVALRDDKLHGLAGGLHRRREIARLALELRRLERAVRDDHGAVEPPDVPLCAPRVRRLV